MALLPLVILAATPLTALVVLVVLAVYVMRSDSRLAGLREVRRLLDTFLRGTAEIVSALRRRHL